MRALRLSPAGAAAFILLLLAAGGGCAAARELTAAPLPGAKALAVAVPWAATRLTATAKEVDPAKGLYPQNTHNATTHDGRKGQWVVLEAQSWTSGFLAGCYYKMYVLSGRQPVWAALGAAQLPGLAAQQYDTTTHDVGFKLMTSYGQALAAKAPGTPVGAYRRVLRNGAASLAQRFDPVIGVFRSWGNDAKAPQYRTIMDNMLNLELMFTAAALKGGKKEWYDMAVSHAERCLKDFFRKDGSTFHVVKYDSKANAILWKGTAQGYTNSSTWARGQAWAIRGFAAVAQATGDAKFTAASAKAAKYFMAHLPTDGVPYWDFHAPTGMRWKDTSAAAIAASGLLRLARHTGNGAHIGSAVKLLNALVPKYTSSGTKPRLSSILRAGTGNAPKGVVNTGLIYGDYYLLEALQELELSALK